MGRPSRAKVSFLLAALFAPSAMAAPAEWRCPSGNTSLDGRATISGHIAEPHIAWSHFVGIVESILVVAPNDSPSEIAIPVPECPQTAAESDDVPWGLRPPTGLVGGKDQPIENTSCELFADILPDTPGFEKVEFESGFSLPTVNGQWQPARVRAFAWDGSGWARIWETEPFDLLFSPYPIAGDFDADGKLEIAFLPWRELVLLDASTGRIKDRCRFTEGRSYGFFGVFDFDRDGRSEFLVEADFAKHVDVLGFQEGKLSLFWKRDIELDIANPQVVLRVNPSPVADCDGDGVLEVLVNVYNGSSDGRWRIEVCDGMTSAVEADLADAYLEGVADIDRDKRDELLVSKTSGGGVPDYGPAQVWRIEADGPRLVWEMADAGWQRWEPSLPRNVNSGATLGKRTALVRTVGETVEAVLRHSLQSGDGIELRRVSWRDDAFHVEDTVCGPSLEALALDADGAMLVKAIADPGKTANVAASSGLCRAIASREIGPARGVPVVGWPRDAPRPVVVVQGPDERLVAFHPQSDKPAETIWRISGRAQGENWPGVRGAVIADLAGDGTRQILYATASPTGCARFAAADLVTGTEAWHHDFPEIPGSDPVWNIGGAILWQDGHFTNSVRTDILITVRRSMMHSEETLLLSGRDGTQLWRRDRQISQRGVGGIPLGVGDFDGDGLDDAASFHPSLFYILDGATGEDIIAKDAVWDDVPSKPVYWGRAVSGDFDKSGQNGVFMAGAALTGLVRADGSLVWWDALDHSPSCFAFGDFDADGAIEAMGYAYPDGVRVYTAATGVVEARLAVDPIPAPAGAASADLDGDGRDEGLFAVGGGLICVSIDESGAGLEVRWRIDLPAAVSGPSIVQLDAKGSAAILVSGSDGRVYCIQ